MLKESRLDIYDYLYNLFYDNVSKNVYKMGEPMDNTKSDIDDGFLVIRVGNMVDNSEFLRDCYAEVRCYVTAYIPKKTRGRVDAVKYKAFEDAVNEVIENEILNGRNVTYTILPDDILSMDDDETTPKGNQFHLFVKSFIVGIDDSEEIDE